MKSHYSVFGCINVLRDRKGDVRPSDRGYRKRPVPTEIYVVDGAIRLEVNGVIHEVNGGDQFTVSSNSEHRWTAFTDCTVLQMIKNYKASEDSKL